MPDLIPMTRQEKFLNGDTDLEPITRREHFYAGREGELPEGSQDPQTREEYFIKKYRGGGGGDITVESLSVTSNGTYTAPSGKAYSPVEVNVPLPQNAYLNKSLTGLPADIATFNDGEALPLSNLKVGIEPVQDLHGYDYPWAGGAGKNKLEVTATSQTIDGVTFTINTDGTIKCSGNASTTITLSLNAGETYPSGSYILSGCPSGGGNSTYKLDLPSVGYATDTGSGVTFSVDGTQGCYPRIVIYAGNGDGLVFKPMIRLSSIVDDTFAPYENECPISGWSEANVGVSGKNLFGELNPDKWINADGDLINDNDSMVSQLLVAKPNQQYVLSSSNSISTLCICFYDKNMNKLLRVAQTSVGQITGIAPIGSVFMYAGSYKSHNNLQLELGSTATTYESYAGNLIIVAFGQTLYGGYIDWANNRIVGTHRIFEVTKNNSGLSVIQIGSTGHYRIRFYTTGAKSYGVNDVFDGVCNFYKPVSSNATYGRTVGVGIQSGNVAYIYDTIWDYQTALDDFKTWLDSNPITLTYELATPVIIPLDLPQVKSLEGVNNLFADCGQVQELSYFSK